jgi:hypothetical protein
MFDLEQDAVICSGPRRGRQFTYALFSERVAASEALSSEAALAELARRYFQSHGPATLRDFAWWSGLPMRAAREGVALAQVDVLASPPVLQRVPGATFLLPNYDEYLIAYRDRGAVIDPDRARNLGVFTSREHPHQVIVDGRVAGSWRRTISENKLLVELWPYARLSKPHREALDAQAARYAQFLGLTYELRLDTAAARSIK